VCVCVCVCEFIKTSQGSEVVKTNTFLTVSTFGEQSVGVLSGTRTNNHCLWLQLITVLFCNKALYLQTTSLFVYVDILGKFFLRIIFTFKDLHASTAEVIVFTSLSSEQFAVASPNS